MTGLQIVRQYGVVSEQRTGAAFLRRFGVPLGGPFDTTSHGLALALARWSPDAATLELGLANVTLLAEQDGVLAAVGAEAAIEIDGRAVACQAAHTVREGSEIRVLPPTAGARVYLTFRPGPGGSRRLAEPPDTLGRGPFRVIPGPQADRFDLDRLLQPIYGVAQASNRGGLRLEGGEVSHEIELPSEPACLGAIQVTPSGMPIVLGPDGPTIGGYPKPLVIAAVDLDRLGQLRPGEEVRFRLISMDEATTKRRERQARLAALTSAIRLS